LSSNGPVNSARYLHTATLLANGSLLVTGNARRENRGPLQNG